jgi:hypothetical protein
MKERIDVYVPDRILALNETKKERLLKTNQLQPTDRTPVVVDAQLWALLAGRKGSYAEMLKGPREHLRGQILNWKWRVEKIPDDRPIETETLRIESDFGALKGLEFPIEILFDGDRNPKSKHLLNSPEEIDSLTVPPPDGGFNALRIEWYHAMSTLKEDFDVRLNGEPVEIQVDLNNAGGPFPSAFALCGSNIFLWMKTDPERVHRLMEITTQSHEQVFTCFDELTGRKPGGSVWLGADASEMISREMYSEFIVPYYLHIWENHAFPRPFHMCGKIDHLLEILRDDFQVTTLAGFGFPVDRHKLAETLSGRMVLHGGPHPLLIHDGTRDQIILECMEYIHTAGGKGGYILAEGFGLMPGTPMENIEAMVEASKRSANQSL